MINLLKVRKTQVRGLNCVSFSENLFYVKTNQMIRNISRGREREGEREREREGGREGGRGRRNQHIYLSWCTPQSEIKSSFFTLER